MNAVTSLLISLYAAATLAVNEPLNAPTEPATDAAPVSAEILELSSARRVTLPESMSVKRLLISEALSMNDLTLVFRVFTAAAPVALLLTPTPPAAIATEPATTRASMDWSENAVRVTSPAALTWLFKIELCTSAGELTRLTCFQRSMLP